MISIGAYFLKVYLLCTFNVYLTFHYGSFIENLLKGQDKESSQLEKGDLKSGNRKPETRSWTPPGRTTEGNTQERESDEFFDDLFEELSGLSSQVNYNKDRTENKDMNKNRIFDADSNKDSDISLQSLLDDLREGSKPKNNPTIDKSFKYTSPEERFKPQSSNVLWSKGGKSPTINDLEKELQGTDFSIDDLFNSESNAFDFDDTATKGNKRSSVDDSLDDLASALQTSAAPKMEDFSSFEKYLDALVNFERKSTSSASSTDVSRKSNQSHLYSSGRIDKNAEKTFADQDSSRLRPTSRGLNERMESKKNDDSNSLWKKRSTSDEAFRFLILNFNS
jgi:hypothetical protein